MYAGSPRVEYRDAKCKRTGASKELTTASSLMATDNPTKENDALVKQSMDLLELLLQATGTRSVDLDFLWEAP